MNADAAGDRAALETALGYRFKTPERLTRALCHSSYINEQPQQGMASNERLEFLGDAVLNLGVSHLLMARSDPLTEGEMSRNRADLVNETQLAAIARELGLGAYLLLGKGEEQTDGREKNSILADAVEAVIAAIYLDGGFDAAFRFVARQFADRINAVGARRFGTDFKSRLQERVQAVYHEVPRYEVVDARGPDHDKTFRVRMSVAGITAEADGKSKKMAEQNAARAGLALLDRPA